MTKSTRRALFSSVVALVICLTMLIGTTFAWFTDTASTAVNTIQSGKLDVVLEMKDADGNWVPAEGETISFVNAKGETDILWEPGCTFETTEFRIRNAGNLALKYQIYISGINGSAKLNEVIDWYYSTEISSTLGFGDGWTTPTDATSLEVLSSEKYLYPEDSTGLAMSNAHVFKIVGHMQETADNTYMGEKIEGIAITVVATQYTYEYDSKDNTYDAEAEYPEVWDGKTIEATTTVDEYGVYHITSASEFVYYLTNVLDGLNSGRNYVLDCDIDLGGKTIDFSNSVARVLGSNFDGQNHTVSNFKIECTKFGTALFGYSSADKSDRTIKNLIVKNATVVGGDQTAIILAAANTAGPKVTVENCKVYDSTVTGNKKVATIVGYTESGTVSNCYAENCKVYCIDDRANQAGEVVGYINVTGGHVDNVTDNNNTFKNVTVVVDYKD